MLVPPRSTYRDYLLALSSSYTIYRDLSTFFDASPLVCTKLNYDRETQVPREGEVIIMDCMSDTFITQHYLMGAASSDEEAKKCIVDLEQRPPTTQTRIIIISYWRDTITGEYTGLNKDVLGAVGLKYMIHPEVFMWHFGSDYGLADDWFPNATTPLPSALSSRTYFHLHNHQTLVSPYLHIPNGTAKADTVIIFARNFQIPDSEALLLSRVNLPASASPTSLPVSPSSLSQINSLFVLALKQLDADDVRQCDRNPIECILPYARIALLNASALIDWWAQKAIAHYQESKIQTNVEVRYDEQVATVKEVRSNLLALQTFTSEISSVEWKFLLLDYERSLQEFEQQLKLLAQKMSHRASMASLKESKVSIEHAEKGLQQNARVKRLTQLAFVFIPLTFTTSMFGMNLHILGSGSVNAWTVVAASALVYLSVSLLWILFHYRGAAIAWIAVKASIRPARKFKEWTGYRRRSSSSTRYTSTRNVQSV